VLVPGATYNSGTIPRCDRSARIPFAEESFIGASGIVAIGAYLHLSFDMWSGAAVHVNGIDLHYTVEGEGFPCLVPRPAGTSIIERTFSPRLREKLQLIIFDPRGCGRSGDSRAECDLDDLLADIDGLRATLGQRTLQPWGNI